MLNEGAGEQARPGRDAGVWPSEIPDGLVVMRSSRTHVATVDTLLAGIGERGLRLMVRLDHAADALSAGLDLPPTDLFIFGNPASGTPLMQETPSIAIDLPLKMLVATDTGGTCWLTYNDPVWTARRHGLSVRQGSTARAMRAMLAAICLEAAGRASE